MGYKDAMRPARHALRLIALLTATAFCAPASATAPKPMRVMSINLCADQMTMLLLPPERISSVTYLAARHSAPALAAEAKGLKVNHGLAEEVLTERPDLIVGSRYTSPTTRRLVKALGIPLVELDTTDSFADVRAQMRTLGAAFGESARAEALIGAMDARLADLRRTAPARPIRAVSWDGSGRTPGRRSMFNAVLEAAGGVNLAASPGAFERMVDLEQLMRAQPQPDVLLYGASDEVEVGEQVRLRQHPVLMRAYAGRRLAYPQAPVTCGSPYSAEVAAGLRAAMLAAMARGAR